MGCNISKNLKDNPFVNVEMIVAGDTIADQSTYRDIQETIRKAKEDVVNVIEK